MDNMAYEAHIYSHQQIQLNVQLSYDNSKRGDTDCMAHFKGTNDLNIHGNIL